MFNIGDHITIYFTKNKFINPILQTKIYVVVRVDGSGLFYRQLENEYTRRISNIFVQMHKSIADQRREKINSLFSE